MADFVRIHSMKQQAGIPVPQWHAMEPSQGFLLLDDLGARTALEAFSAASTAEADGLMRGAIDVLVHWQQHGDALALPPYDEALIRQELALFPQWCVQRFHHLPWTPTQEALWQRVCDALTTLMLTQPQCAVHHDFTARHLVLSANGIAVLGHPHAVRGPITYDIASLLRDACWSWDEVREIDWAVRYWEATRRAGLPVDQDFGMFWRAIEWTGLQRHLATMGLFSRLAVRDGRTADAAHLPRLRAYAVQVATRYGELKPLVPLLRQMDPSLFETGVTLR